MNEIEFGILQKISAKDDIVCHVRLIKNETVEAFKWLQAGVRI
jgi:hypothetical protein